MHSSTAFHNGSHVILKWNNCSDDCERHQVYSRLNVGQICQTSRWEQHCSCSHITAGGSVDGSESEPGVVHTGRPETNDCRCPAVPRGGQTDSYSRCQAMYLSFIARPEGLVRSRALRTSVVTMVSRRMCRSLPANTRTIIMC